MLTPLVWQTSADHVVIAARVLARYLRVSVPAVLDRRQLLVGAAAGASLLVARRASAAGPSAAQVKALYDRATVIDMLAVVAPGPNGRIDDDELRVIRAGGLTAVNVTVGIPVEN